MFLDEQNIKAGQHFDGHYQLLRPLSTDGGTADVWLAIDTITIDSSDDLEGESTSKDSGMLVAIKIYRPKNALDIAGEQRFREEFKIVYECRHENLLQPTGFSVYNGIPYLVLPYCKNGSSEQLIGKQLSSDEIWKFILDVSSGLNRLHTNEHPIIHQDIKPANVLIDNNKDYAITDFGISSKRDGGHNFYYDDDNSGTMAYMAPERFQENTLPMPQSDIWAFGATLFEILTGNVPFGEEGGRFQSENRSHIPQIGNISADIQRLINDCLAFEPGNRPSAKDIKEAALVRTYPVKSRKRLLRWVGIVAFVSIVVGFSLFSLLQKDNDIAQRPMEDIYNEALLKICCEEVDSVKEGIALMDSLCNLKYIPAIYQMAYTYGWYNEDESLRRKSMLGIEVFDNEESGLNLPKSDRYSNEALALFSQILELNDSNYANINAQAAYRLACYYVNPNQIIKANIVKGKSLLQLSRKWAILDGDKELVERIDNSLQSFGKY